VQSLAAVANAGDNADKRLARAAWINNVMRPLGGTHGAADEPAELATGGQRELAVLFDLINCHSRRGEQSACMMTVNQRRLNWLPRIQIAPQLALLTLSQGDYLRATEQCSQLDIALTVLISADQHHFNSTAINCAIDLTHASPCKARLTVSDNE
jgi:hypothetical protein